MNNMQQVLSVLVSGPVVLPSDFDEIPSSVGNNEQFYSFNVNDYVHYYQDGNDGKIVTDNNHHEDTENSKVILVDFLHGYSKDPDSNDVSRKLVELYRNELLGCLKY